MAQIQRFKPMLLAGYLNTKERAVLRCGCCIFVGINSDTQAASTAAQPCSEAHEVITDLASEILRGWLPLPPGRPLVGACRDALTKAAKQF